MNWYTVYRTADDSIAALGTASECAKQLAYKKVNSLYGIVSRIKRGKHNKYYVIVSPLNGGEKDEDYSE